MNIYLENQKIKFLGLCLIILLKKNSMIIRTDNIYIESSFEIKKQTTTKKLKMNIKIYNILLIKKNNKIILYIENGSNIIETAIDTICLC